MKVTEKAIAFVLAAYRRILQREPNGDELRHWVAVTRALGPGAVLEAMFDCGEYLHRHRVNLRSEVWPGHFYSPVVDPEALLEAGFSVDREIDEEQLPGLDFRAGEMTALWRRQLPAMLAAPFPAQKTAPFRYFGDNDSYAWGDAYVLLAMFSELKPRRVLEIGSGFSSACMLDIVDHLGLATTFTFVDPNLEILFSLLRDADHQRCTILQTPVQALARAHYEALEAGDILFIDSTHVSKTGSDVNFELFEMLPRLKPGVVIHFHDTFYPFEYPDSWIFEARRSWNELYILRAFLADNPNYEMVFFNDYFGRRHARKAAALPYFKLNPGGGLWLRKVPQGRGATLSSAGSSSETASAEQPRLTALPAVAVDTTLREHARFTAPGSAYEEFDPRILEGCPRLSGGKPPLVAAFYLPQFHPTLENDAFWGKGFTEWRQLPRGIPRFRDHYQPRIPRDLGFYNQTDQDTIRRQAGMARAAGIGAFAYYYYRFGRKRVLDAPLELLLESDIEMPFFLIWANESWTRTWDGSENDILLKQDYRAEDEAALLADLARHMRDGRYLRLDGRPLLIIYNPGHIPNCAEAVARWREAWRTRHRLDPLIFMAQTFGYEDPREFGFDGALEFPPHNLSTQIDDHDIEPISADFKGRVIKYDDLAAASLAKPMADFPLVKTLVPSWDNEPRRPNRGLVVRGSTPAAYQAWLEALVERAMERPVHGTPLVAVNAWNEWAEGAYLEPDIHFGGAYLNATARGINAAVSTRYAQE